jgi:sulfofructose kinase
MLISGAGMACLDYLYIAPETPRGGSAPISDFLIQGGGLVGTALVTCARLGAQAALYARLGKDEVGDRILRELHAEGVDVENVQLCPESTSPFSFIHVDKETGERTIFFRSAHNIPSPIQHPDLRTVTRSNAALVDDSLMDLSLAVASAAKANGIPVVGDMLPNSRNAELLACVDALIVPRFFLESDGVQGDIDRALDAIRSYGPSIAVITLGESGWVYSSPDGKGRGDAFSVDVVDTTGAGDVFHGAFAFGMASGWGTEMCCRFSAAVAALKCTRMGGRTGIPSYQAAMAFIANQPD